MTRNLIGAQLPSLSSALRGENIPQVGPLLWKPQDGPQTVAYQSTADILGYGGAAGGGKTDLILGCALTQHARSLILRWEATQLSDLVERSRDLITGQGSPGRFNENLSIWRDLPGGRVIRFGGLAKRGDENKYKGRPNDLLAIDEATEWPEDIVRFLRTWNRSTRSGQKCQTILTFNPPTNAEGRWVIAYFAPWLDDDHPRPAAPGELRWFASLDGVETEVDGPAPISHKGETIHPESRTFIFAYVSDNRYWEGTNYLSRLQGLTEPLRSQMLHGDFKAGMVDDSMQCIPTRLVKEAQGRWSPYGHMFHPLSATGVDVALGGTDENAIVRRHGLWLDTPITFPGTEAQDGQYVADKVLDAVREGGGTGIINIDAIGVGAAPYTCLRAELGDARVRPVKFSERALAPDGQPLKDASTTFAFGNMRAYAYWHFREMLERNPQTTPPDELVSLPPDKELVADLCAPRYFIRAGRIWVEPKPDVIKRTKRHLHKGDAAVLAALSDLSTPFEMPASAEAWSDAAGYTDLSDWLGTELPVY